MSVDNFTNIDFDGLKTAFREFLKDSPQFKDYNFEGSNLSVLLDVLAMNTYKNQFFLNMALSEMFLDTAQLRDSIVSHAKELNYLPRSAKSANATIDVEIFPNDDPAVIVMPIGSRFGARIDNSVYTFITDRAYTILPSAGEYRVEDVPVYEGQYVIENFIVDTSTAQRFVLGNPNVDIDSLIVKVYPSATATSFDEFFYASSFLGLTSSSKVYFIQAAEAGKYELFFGDGVLGAALENLNMVQVMYRTCNLDLPNKATDFVSLGSIAGYSNVSVTTVSSASGGAVAEGVESIRYNAPRYFQAQERAVNASDFETLLRINFPEIQAISVFGGEEMDPPQYGRVIISVDLSDTDGVPDSKKTEIEEFIKTRGVLTVNPRVISPEFIYVEVVSQVNYDTTKTTLSTSDLQSAVITAMAEFAADNLDDFNVNFIASKLMTAIDAADVSILGNSTSIRAVSYFNPELDTTVSHKTVDFQNALAQDILDTSNPSLFEPAITSSNFTYTNQSCVLEDNGAGVIQIINKNGTERNVLLTSAGTVDYATGKITLNGFSVSDYTGSAIKLYARPILQELNVSRNVILSLDISNVTVSVMPV